MFKWGGETLNNNSSIDISIRQIEKAIIGELFKKELITFVEYNNIIQKLDEDIIRLENKLDKKEELTNIIVKIPI